MALWEVAAPRRALTVSTAPALGQRISGLVVLNTRAACACSSRWRRSASPLRRPNAAGACSITSTFPSGWRVPVARRRAGLRDLASARHVPCGAAPVAPAPGAPRRPGLRRDHRRALPPGRDRPVDADQARRHRRAGGARSWPYWSSRSCSMPWPCSTTATCRCPAASTARCAGSIVTPDMHRVHHSMDDDRDEHATSVSTCPGGIGSSAPTGRGRACRRSGWRSASRASPETFARCR